MKKRNEMMDRPVIDNDVREYLRTAQKQLDGEIGNIEKWANDKRVPIIPHETVTFFNWLLPLLQPKEILEIGTAIGFSAGLMIQASSPGCHVTTIERNPDMIEKAKVNFKKMNIESNVTLLEGQASDWLEKLKEESVDFIFMDSAKAKYYDFFPHCYRLLKQGGVLAIDDVLQGGTILDDDEDVPRRRRKIHKKLNAFLDIVMDHPAFDSSVVPLGDGLLLITKREAFDFSFMLPEKTDQ
ncbi:Predicted O-methyltransferase YrrM [Alkalibacterium putridalgicola]|uniref:tRNA 5-hydroxyuridine methyltransferase n=1 Tax=Alkalibacterium putridalgicola TaxID=426703 RepID=A0A1H7WPN7_9LACT|nr:O-methyltransferase [Alkalibacterium putridalgicola]GEK90110.1 O-methyltransferase [Alkalibacterium putridalgicola]SEM23460.1 Predicted O-methyltransferase YrrM [Alkalibacterium putridalgicola]